MALKSVDEGSLAVGSIDDVVSTAFTAADACRRPQGTWWLVIGHF
jgi:hypothetical protein